MSDRFALPNVSKPQCVLFHGFGCPRLDPANLELSVLDYREIMLNKILVPNVEIDFPYCFFGTHKPEYVKVRNVGTVHHPLRLRDQPGLVQGWESAF